MLTLDHASPYSLTEQIVRALIDKIGRGVLASGSRLPSVRGLAAQTGASTFTVAEAYNRLVASGWVEARRARGYFVASARTAPPVPTARPPVDDAWLLRHIYEDPGLIVPAGCGWLPEDWLYGAGVRAALRRSARSAAVAGYGHPQGLPALRRHLQWRLALRGIDAAPEQLLLTQGASQGLDLAMRSLVRPGETVLVDAPGYSNLLAALHSHGARPIGVPRTAHGPDPDELNRLAQQWRPVAFFTNSALQNPTGSSTTAATAFRILQTAERHDFRLVEDDPFADLAVEPQATLASLDGLRRVVHIGSFSKTVSPALRQGFVAADAATIAAMTRLRMAVGLTGSEIMEATTLAIVEDGRHRAHLERLRERLGEAQAKVAEQLDRLGWQLFMRPRAGMFLWAAAPQGTDPDALTDRAAAAGIALAPGRFYLTTSERSNWFRFNVAWADDSRLYDFLLRAESR
ncbi:aminotransferase-like domain-containing protein [Chitinimonas lacunae]|uniref:Putative 8-amino-7-oxononanoate synthase n=1 Tax=Chitinimonas lacunae TaxID=1963018 RepID=A0ABV8MRC7_9NEIS